LSAILREVFRLQTLQLLYCTALLIFHQAGLASDDAQNVAAALQTWLATDDEHSMAQGWASFCECIQDDVYAIQL